MTPRDNANPLPPGDRGRDPDLARVRTLLPWLVGGRLEPSERLFVDGWLRAHSVDHPEIGAELAWLFAATQMARKERDLQPVEQGLAELMQRIAAEPKANAVETSAQPALRPSATSLWQRLHGWLSGLVDVQSPALAFGVAALVLVQAGVIATLLVRPPTEQAALSGAGGPAMGADSVQLTIAFKPTATEEAIRQLLGAQGAQIIGGPSALGLYRIAVPKARADAAVAAMAAADAVESVQRDR